MSKIPITLTIDGVAVPSSIDSSLFPAGLNGATGLTGATGAQGPIGPAGPQGPIGPAGPAGTVTPTPTLPPAPKNLVATPGNGYVDLAWQAVA